MVKATRSTVLKVLDALFSRGDRDVTSIGLSLQSFRQDNVQWLHDRRIIGYGFPGKGGYFANSKAVPKVALYVDHEDNVEALEGEVPTWIHVPGLDTPLATEVVNIGEMLPTAAKCRPLVSGSSVSHVDMPAGTLSAIVSRRCQDDTD